MHLILLPSPWRRLALAARVLFGGCYVERLPPDRWHHGPTIVRVGLYRRLR